MYIFLNLIQDFSTNQSNRFILKYLFIYSFKWLSSPIIMDGWDYWHHIIAWSVDSVQYFYWFSCSYFANVSYILLWISFVIIWYSHPLNVSMSATKIYPSYNNRTDLAESFLDLGCRYSHVCVLTFMKRSLWHAHRIAVHTHTHTL